MKMKHIKKFESFSEFPLNEAINKPLPEFGQMLEDKFKKAGFKTGVFQNMGDGQIKTAEKKIEEDPSMVLFNFQTGMNTIQIHFNRDKKREILKIINQYQLPLRSFKSKETKDGKVKSISNAMNPGDIYLNNTSNASSIEDQINKMPPNWKILKIEISSWTGEGKATVTTSDNKKGWG